ncbi:polysaccharide biosynthesis C-terminal domain-containing protein [Halobacterium salinarum]|uniref:polysaccharide biosynthesis C-terminal domain-containing protein n=1 Tax=Halobacterium salinarum TaxID=2242 RepID=UPI001F1687D6|nr:polysaccharide biosynthesis C-terminal domain-containing protein [Halobacterium salinarum]MCF2208634.1 polysaccharide biosynthesis C-terminal domain-containing protein [Halobacterium salinarum]
MRRQYHLVGKWIFLTTTPVFALLVVYPEFIIQTLFGNEYASGSLALIVLTVGFYIHAILGLNGTTLTSIGRTRLILLDNIAAAGLNIGLNFWLIPRYDFIGAAISTTASYILINILYSIQLYYVRSIPPITFKISITAVSATALIAVWVKINNLMPSTLSNIVTFTFAFGLCYVSIAVGVIGVEQEEIDLVLHTKDKISERFFHISKIFN